MEADLLLAVRMKKEDMGRADVQAFRCGKDPHETPLAEWIKVHSAERMGQRHKIWLYHRQTDGGGQGPLVGYGSLATGKIETSEGGGGKKTLKVIEIPMLALHEDFWGHPKGLADPEGKYSRQIVRHLQREAQEAQKRGQQIERLLTLYVHPDAEAARKLYLACGFIFAPGRFLYDPDTDTFCLGMTYQWD
jgi:hypothetical protein